MEMSYLESDAVRLTGQARDKRGYVRSKSHAPSLHRWAAIASNKTFLLLGRGLLGVMVVLAVPTMGCDPNARCRSIEVGSRYTGPEAKPIGLVARLRWFRDTIDRGDNFSKGPVQEAVCCLLGPPNGFDPALCAETLASTDCQVFAGAEFVEILAYSYSDEENDDTSQFCDAVLKDGMVVGVWSHYWW